MNESTRTEIRKAAWRILRESGNDAPPVSVQSLLEFRRIHRHFYDLENPTFLDEIKHKVHIHGRKLIEIPRKIKLVALSLFDSPRILIDATVPDIRRDWPTCHELTHQILPWHRTYFRGDTAQTLDPDWQEALEDEANFGAGEFSFCGNTFSEEAKDTLPCWESVEAMRKRYRRSLASTLRRYVETGPDSAMAMLISTPPWQTHPRGSENPLRRCGPSAAFLKRFSRLDTAGLLEEVNANVQKRRGGPVADFQTVLNDDNGDAVFFHVETFFNGYDLLTLFVEIQRRHAKRTLVSNAIGMTVF